MFGISLASIWWTGAAQMCEPGATPTNDTTNPKPKRHAPPKTVAGKLATTNHSETPQWRLLPKFKETLSAFNKVAISYIRFRWPSLQIGSARYYH
jgi:hypothetical protein